MVKTLNLKGSFKEIGRLHGKEGKQEVTQSLETYERLFHGYSKINWAKAREQAMHHYDAVEKHDPDLIEEMVGLAEGAGVDFEDIFVLNARSEIALANYGEDSLSFADGCTAIAVTPPLSDDTIIGQNWDWKGTQEKSLLLLNIEQKGKPVIKMVTEGGIIGKIGMNMSGVAVCLNALLTNKKTKQVPVHLGLRSVLNSSSLHEAISKIKSGQMASTANFLIASEQGPNMAMAANVEVSPVGIDMMGAENGSVTHTNHICSQEIKQQIEDRNEFIFDDSMIRKNRAEQLVNMKVQQKQKITEDDFKEWFSDRFNYPNSINHYQNLLAPDHRRNETVFSIIMNLSKKKMQLCVGKPSVEGYEEV
jgi:isopenicillin-N N-acyltransferase-like protein